MDAETRRVECLEEPVLAHRIDPWPAMRDGEWVCEVCGAPVPAPGERGMTMVARQRYLAVSGAELGRALMRAFRR